jgi:hypothetical protein
MGRKLLVGVLVLLAVVLALVAVFMTVSTQWLSQQQTVLGLSFSVDEIDAMKDRLQSWGLDRLNSWVSSGLFSALSSYLFKKGRKTLLEKGVTEGKDAEPVNTPEPDPQIETLERKLRLLELALRESATMPVPAQVPEKTSELTEVERALTQADREVKTERAVRMAEIDLAYLTKGQPETVKAKNAAACAVVKAQEQFTYALGVLQKRQSELGEAVSSFLEIHEGSEELETKIKAKETLIAGLRKQVKA